MQLCSRYVGVDMAYDLTKYKSDWVDMMRKNELLDLMKKTGWSLDDEDKTPWEDDDEECDKEPGHHCTQEMAERIMDALCADGRGDLLLIQDDEIRAWWAAITKQRKAERDRIEAERREIELRENALRKLTPDERRALGLK